MFLFDDCLSSSPYLLNFQCDNIHFFDDFYVHPVSQVEHVLREEKTKAAYELIEIYCELIAARLPMIESQKYVNPIVLSSLFVHVLLCLNLALLCYASVLIFQCLL